MAVVDKALYKAVIKVDEYGTEAAAATVQSIIPYCMPKMFTTDHPFIYFIVSADRQINKHGDNFEQKEATEILFAATFC